MIDEASDIPVGGVDKSKLTPAEPEKKNGHLLPFYNNQKKEVPFAQFITEHKAEYDSVNGPLLDLAKASIPKAAGEDDRAYQKHLLDALEDRFCYPSDYAAKTGADVDALYTALKARTDLSEDKWPFILMAIEVARGQAGNEGVALSEFGKEKRREIRKSVSRDAGVRLLSEDHEPIYDPTLPTATLGASERKMTEKAKKALGAFTLIADDLLDVEDSSFPGRARTYRSRLKDIQGQIEKQKKGQPPKWPLAVTLEVARLQQQLRDTRRRFYAMAQNAIKFLDKDSERPDQANHKDAAVFNEMRNRLKVLRQVSSSQPLVDYFVGQGSRFAKPAYKGVGYTGIQYTPAHAPTEPAPPPHGWLKEAKMRSANRKKIRAALKDVQFDDFLDFALQGGDLMQRRVSESSSAVHYVTEKKLIGTKKGKDALADLSGGGDPDPNLDPHTDPTLRTDPVLPPPELLTSFNLALVAVPDHLEQNLVALRDAAFAHDTAKFSSPKTVLGRLLQPLRHPVKYIWQNALFRPIFQQQALRFSADIMQTAKDSIGFDRSIPLHVGQEIIKKVLTEGDALRKKKNFIQRFAFYLGDKVNGIVGIGQNSEQRLAKQWLKENGKDYIQTFKERGLTEQTALGLEYSVVEQKDGQTFANSVVATNKNLISETLGETRYALSALLGASQTGKDVYTFFSDKVKVLIQSYATNTITKEQLVAEINTTFRSAVLSHIPEDKRKEISGSELGSNILPIAEYVKTNWSAYSKEENHLRKIDSLNLNFIVGRREWGGARGKQEVGTLTHLLAQRIAEKQVGTADGSRLAAVGIFKWMKDAAKDVVTYGGAYALGSLAFAPRTAIGALKAGMNLSPLGGVLATAITAGVKEGGLVVARDGKLHGISGRYLHEFQQVSREYAGGASGGEHSPIRNEMIQKALVDSQEASKLTVNITTLAKKETLSEVETKQLTLHVAHAKARLHLTDLSSIREGSKLALAQNFIRFHESVETQEMAALRGSIAEGVIKLHRGAEDQTALDKKLMEVQAVFEGTLQIGGQVEKVSAIVARSLNKNATESRQLVDQYLHAAGEAGIVAEGKSLNEAMSALAKLNSRRAWTTAGKVALIAPVAGIVAKLGYEEVAHAVHDVQTKGDLLSGLGEYAESWKKTIIDGQIPLRVDTVAGVQQVVTDATPLQQGLLQARALIEPPLGSFWHQQTIDNAIINFNAGVRYGDFNGHHYISDMRSGEVVDLGNNHFDVQSGKLLLVDPANHAVDAQSYFGGKLQVGKGPDIQEFHEVKTLVPGQPGTAGNPEQAFLDHATKTDHREWYSYNAPGSQGNELQALTFKNGDAVTVDYSHMTTAWQKGLNPDHIDVQDMLKNPQNYDGQLGMYIQAPGHPNEGMFIPDFNHDGKIIFDPHDTVHTITLPNGQTMTMADAANQLVNQGALGKLKDGNIATELYNNRDVWNFAADGQNGYGMVGRLVTQNGKQVFQSFATFEGSSPVAGMVPGAPTEQITQQLVTHETFNIVGKPFELNLDFVQIPLYWRQNVERSESQRELPENYTPLAEVKSFQYAPPSTAAVDEEAAQKQLLVTRQGEITARLREIEGKPESAAEVTALSTELQTIEGKLNEQPVDETVDAETKELQDKLTKFKLDKKVLLEGNRNNLSDALFEQYWGHKKTDTDDDILIDKFISNTLAQRFQDEEMEVFEHGELKKTGDKLDQIEDLVPYSEVIKFAQEKTKDDAVTAITQLIETTFTKPEFTDALQSKNLQLTKDELTTYLLQIAEVIRKIGTRLAAVSVSEKAALKTKLQGV